MASEAKRRRWGAQSHGDVSSWRGFGLWQIPGPLRLAPRIILALCCVAVASLLRLVLDDLLGSNMPYLLFAVAILVSVIWGGTAAGICAWVPSQLLGAMFARFTTADLDNVIDAIMFAVVSIAIITVSQKMNALRQDAQRSEQEAHRRREQAELANEELNLLIDGARGYAFNLLEAKGCITIWNGGAERLTGWREQDIIGRHVEILYPPTARADHAPERDLDEARTSGKMEGEAWRLRSDGTEFLAHVTITALHDAEGRVTCFGQILHDITHERAAANELRSHAAHLRSILSAVPTGMLVADETGQIQFFSAAAEQMFGVSSAQVIGMNVTAFVPAIFRDAHEDYMRKFAQGAHGDSVTSRRMMVNRWDGSAFHAEVATAEAISGDQRILTAFIRDLTEQDAMDARLDELQQTLIHATRVSSMGTMASTLAHEINQPLAAAILYAESVRAAIDDDDPEMGKALDEAICQARRVGDIVRKLREFVAHGEITRTNEDLSALIEEALEVGRIRQTAGDALITLALDPDVGGVFVDHVQIQQVVINLLRNALEASQGQADREVHIATMVEGRFARVTVSDNGPGVSPVIAERLFTAFNTSKGTGLGLGLSICRTIVEANGGRIWYEARPDGGSLFHFSVPRTYGLSDREYALVAPDAAEGLFAR